MKVTREDIVFLRQAFGYTRKQLAFLCDVSYGYIAGVENGHFPVSDKLNRNIIARLDITEERLMAVREVSRQLRELRNN